MTSSHKVEISAFFALFPSSGISIECTCSVLSLQNAGDSGFFLQLTLVTC